MALVTSSETPSSAESTSSSRPSISSTSPTHWRATLTDSGSGSRSSGFLFSGMSGSGPHGSQAHESSDDHRDVENTGELLDHDDAPGVPRHGGDVRQSRARQGGEREE